ncbi:MAG: zf-HC2 domain-containing protein [Bacteroidia bacterium]
MGMLINCEQATLKIIQAESEKQGVFSCLQLKLHLTVCKYCRDFRHQQKLISKALSAKGPLV